MTGWIALMLVAPWPEGGMAAAHRDLVVVVKAQSKVGMQTSLGSGVVVSTTPMVVATCFHVVQHAQSAQVVFAWRSLELSVSKIVTNPDRDLAFLLIEGSGSKREEWKNRVPKLNENVECVAFGDSDHSEIIPNPFRVKRPNVSLISLASMHKVSLPKALFDVIDLLALSPEGLRPGDSGGPIFDLHGELLGLAVGRIDKPEGKPGTSFALISLPPAPQLKDFQSQPDGGLAAYTSFPLPYVGSDGVVPTSVKLARDTVLQSVEAPQHAYGGTVYVIIPHAVTLLVETPFNDCARAIRKAIATLGELPITLPNSPSPECAARYLTVRALSEKIRDEIDRTTSMLDYAMRLRDAAAAISKKEVDAGSIEGLIRPPPRYVLSPVKFEGEMPDVPVHQYLGRKETKDLLGDVDGPDFVTRLAAKLKAGNNLPAEQLESAVAYRRQALTLMMEAKETLIRGDSGQGHKGVAKKEEKRR